MKTLPALPEMATRPRKAAGLDASDASMQKLITAAKNGDVAKVTELLASGIDPDGPAKDGKTPLMEATRGGHVAVVEALVEAFADPVLGKGDETPMTIAFQKGNQDLLKVLFKASFNSLDSSIKPGCMAAFPDSGNPRSDNQEVPDNAEQDLREMTKMIAGLNKERPISPAHQKYGNYAHMASNANADAEKDSDMMREQSVRLAMKSLIKTANAEITGMDSFS
jgi:ankyrin repeat protein